jgi:hypothetical protein
VVRSLAELEPFTGIHFSNELLDAFPVHLVARTDDGWVERHVTCARESFVFTDGPLTDPRLAKHLATIDAPPGFVTEVNLRALDWLSALRGKARADMCCSSTTAIHARNTSSASPGRLAPTRAISASPIRSPAPAKSISRRTSNSAASSSTPARRVSGARVHDQQRFMVGASRLHFRVQRVLPQRN